MGISARPNVDVAGVNLDPARRLTFSPEWNGQSVVFDARSGDFWVVDGKVRNALCLAGADPGLASEYLQRLPAEVIVNLVTHGIIEASSTS